MAGADVRVFVEVPGGSRNKYGLDRETGHIVLDRTLFAPAPADPDDAGDLLLELAPAPPLAGIDVTENEDGRPIRPRERRRSLREANAALARQIARITGLSHSQVNHELNQRVGVERVGEATLEQLERRREAASRWLAVA